MAKKQIVVLARRWFSRARGHTYHAARVFVDGQLRGKAITYGFGSAYEQTAVDLLFAAGVYDPDKYPDNAPVLWKLVRVDHGDYLLTDVVDVETKKGLI